MLIKVMQFLRRLSPLAPWRVLRTLDEVREPPVLRTQVKQGLTETKKLKKQMLEVQRRLDQRKELAALLTRVEQFQAVYKGDTRPTRSLDRALNLNSLVPALSDKFLDGLDLLVRTHWPGVVDSMADAGIGLQPAAARVMRRRPGYEIKPHRDPQGDRTFSYALTDRSLENISNLVRDPAVVDTHQIDRPAFRVESFAPSLRYVGIPAGLEYLSVLGFLGGLATIGLAPSHGRQRWCAGAVRFLDSWAGSRASVSP